MNERKPTIAVTMGDPAGIGPEIILKALAQPAVHERMNVVLIGEREPMIRASTLLHSKLRLIDADRSTLLNVWASNVDAVPFIDLQGIHTAPAFGTLSPEAGDAAYRCVAEAVRLGFAGIADAICTAPLHKEALQLAGHHYPGHTELLADLMGAKDVAMMLVAPGLRVIHVTTHIGLIDAVAKMTPERIATVIRLGDSLLRRSGMELPRIAVCGINPHAGEGGLFGRGEEESCIVPAVKQVIEEGIHAVGPLPADTLFYRAMRGQFDLVVAMYHDQGHGPVKVLGLETGVNISVGLPIIRTSVDHGTAFDIAGQGIADERSLLEALFQAAMLAPSRDARRIR